MSYTINQDKKFWQIIFADKMTNDDLLKLLEDGSNLEKVINPVPNRLIDCTQLYSIDVDFLELSHFASRRRAVTFPNKFKTAFLTKNAVQYGVARMFQALLEHPQITVRVFKDRRDADDWLLQKDDG